MSDVSLNSVADQLDTTEDVPSLVDYAEEPGGAWNPGWYKGEVIEGYATAKGHQFTTEDTVSKNGDSRNMRLCLRLTSAAGERTIQESFNYRTSDFGADRLAYVIALRDENKNNRHWSDRDAQRSSLAIAKLGQIQKSAAIKSFKRTPDGNLIPAALVGVVMDVRLGVDDNGYNIITAFAPAGSKVKK